MIAERVVDSERRDGGGGAYGSERDGGSRGGEDGDGGIIGSGGEDGVGDGEDGGGNAGGENGGGLSSNRDVARTMP